MMSLLKRLLETTKEYLANPTILQPPREDLSFMLYLTTMETAIRAMLAQENEENTNNIYT